MDLIPAAHQIDHHVEDLGGGFFREGQAAGCQLIHEHAKGVDVCGGGDPALGHHLGRHVAAGAIWERGGVVRRRYEGRRQTWDLIRQGWVQGPYYTDCLTRTSILGAGEDFPAS